MWSRSHLFAALLGGVVSACLTAGVLLALGVGDEDESQARRAVPERGVEGRPDGVDWPDGPPREDDGVATGSGFAIGTADRS